MNTFIEQRFRLLAALTAVACLGLVTVACDSTPSEIDSGIISYNGSEPENALIPGDTTEREGLKIIGALFTGLVEYDATTAEPRNAVAQSITTTDSRV